MSFLELAGMRHSCRSFRQDNVPDNVLQSVLEAARLAPSAVNYQPVLIIVVGDGELRDSINSSYEKDWISSAPVLLVVCGDHSSAWRRSDGKDYCDMDVALAAGYMTLAAGDIGLGSSWICDFDAMQVSKLLGTPSHIEPSVMLALGYPDDEGATTSPARERRKALDEIVRFGRYV